MRKVRQFHFTLTIYFTDTYGGVCWRNATALLSQAQWTAQAIACLIALLLLYFNIALISHKCIRLIDNKREVLKPKPRRKLLKLLACSMHEPHAESSADSWFCYLLNVTGSKPCLMAENPKGQWSFPWFLWRSLNPLCDLPPTATLRSRFDSAMYRLLNQMQANILNPKPDGFPLLISL